MEALELALESLHSLVFACHVSAISFGMVKTWIETILHVFEIFLLVCRSVGRLSVVPPGRSDFVDAWSVCKVTQACSLSPEPQRIPKRYQEPVLVFRELKPKFAVSAYTLKNSNLHNYDPKPEYLIIVSFGPLGEGVYDKGCAVAPKRPSTSSPLDSWL